MITWFSWLRNRQRKLRISFGMHSHSIGVRWGTKMFSPIPCMCNLAERTVRTDSTSTACNNVLYREREREIFITSTRSRHPAFTSWRQPSSLNGSCPGRRPGRRLGLLPGEGGCPKRPMFLRGIWWSTRSWNGGGIITIIVAASELRDGLTFWTSKSCQSLILKYLKQCPVLHRCVCAGV